MVTTRFCATCGAANAETQTNCFACGQLLPARVDAEVAPYETLLHARYRLGNTLGSGGYSAVYHGWDTHQGARAVAIKQINLRGLSAEETIEATNTYNREIEALSTLNHPQIPRLYDHFADPDHWYLVLEYIQGQTLETFLNTREALNKALNLAEILAIGLQLCTVLEYLHTRLPPIIFRDLKPSNIMHTPDGKLYLIDFGIARRYAHGQSRDTQSLGSPGYAAPEQYGRAQTDARADIYSLGSLLRQMLTSHDPSEELPALLPSRLNGQPGNAELEALIARMLASDPQNRPRSVFQLARELEHIRQLKSAAQQAKSIWQPPTPQDYTPITAAAAFAGAQVYLQHATIAQPGSGTTPKLTRRKQLTRRRVLIGLGVGVATTALATGIKLWPAAQIGQTVYTYRGHQGSINSVSWSFDSQRLASASSDQSVQTWNALSGNAPAIRQSDSGAVNSVAYTHNGIYATGSADKSVQVWNDQGNLLFSKLQDGPVSSIAWSPDGAYLASASSTMRIWDPSHQTSTSPMLTSETDASVYTAVAWFPGGQYIASNADSSNPDTIESWYTGAVITFHSFYAGHTGEVTCIAWSPNGTYIAAGSQDSTIIVWNTASGLVDTTFPIPNGSVLAISWSPNSQYIASASDDGVVRIWSTSDGSTLVTYTNHTGPVRTVAWSPDGKYIASAGDDMTVQVWKAP